MTAYGLKLAGAGMLVILLGIVGILIFSAIWARIGLVAAMVLLGGGLVLVAWRLDKKARETRAGLERV
jgi:hypothetical protein